MRELAGWLPGTTRVLSGEMTLRTSAATNSPPNESKHQRLIRPLALAKRILAGLTPQGQTGALSANGPWMKGQGGTRLDGEGVNGRPVSAQALGPIERGIGRHDQAFNAWLRHCRKFTHADADAQLWS